MRHVIFTGYPEAREEPYRPGCVGALFLLCFLILVAVGANALQ